MELVINIFSLVGSLALFLFGMKKEKSLRR